MDVVLTILGALGFSAIAISTYVFMVAARNYVSDDHRRFRGSPLESTPQQLVARSPTDRRGGRSVTFPLAVNGILISHCRRNLHDRRVMA
jgi:hypothetical protein